MTLINISLIHQLILKIIESNGGPTPVKVNDLSDIVRKWGLGKQLKRSFVMVQNDEFVNFGGDFLDEAGGSDKIEEVEVTDFMEWELLGCDGIVDGGGEEESRE